MKKNSGYIRNFYCCLHNSNQIRWDLKQFTQQQQQNNNKQSRLSNKT